MGRLFGTDGVRGLAGADLTGQVVLRLASAAVAALRGAGALRAAEEAGRRPLAVVGRDSRASGDFLESGVVAGLAEAGMDVLRLGVIPTPAVAFLTRDLGAELGVVLSASHNPSPDNGVKFFGGGGFKLPDATEDEIEGLLGTPDQILAEPPAAGFGRVAEAPDTHDRYLAHLLGSVAGSAQGRAPLAGLRVVADCAHGAAFELAPRMLRRAGAEVIAVGAQPDGLNINAGCGSTHLGPLRTAVVDNGADVGVAYDGDADRCLAVDAEGQVVDGDQILAILALALAGQGKLRGDTVVATVMSNLGLRLAMRDAGLSMIETAVGDKNVLEAMRAGGYTLGGEQSGHIILLDHATTGDGLLTSLQLLAVAARRGAPLAEVASVMTKYPQVLVNVPGVDKARVAAAPELAAEVAAVSAELGADGRVLVRPSGTEPAVRVMVEALSADQARRIAERLAASIRALDAPPGA